MTITDAEYSRKQIDNLFHSHAEQLQNWKGFEIEGTPCWDRSEPEMERDRR